MSCQEVALTQAICRVVMTATDGIDGPPLWIAHVDLVDPDRGEIRPIVQSDGGRLTFSARSEGLVLSTALAFLEERFGGFSEAPHACVDWQRFVRGQPYVLDGRVVEAM